MSTWGVDSYHISVGVGDCAIHLLTTLDSQPPTVRSAVIVDGGSKGRNKSNADLNITDKTALKPMISWLNKDAKYQYLTSDKLQFRSIVLTHWDEDHWGGLAQTLSRVIGDSNNGQASWLGYDTDGSPLTHFYCPNTSENKAGRLNGMHKDWFRIDPVHSDYIQINTNKADNKTRNGWISFAILFTAQTTYDDRKTNIWNVLGVNFFRGTPVSSPQISSPADLFRYNKPPNPGEPGMYCIGVLEHSFTQANASTTVSEEEDVQPEDSPWGVVPENPTTTNCFSIAAMILWPSGRCSHYFAGDADEESEENFLTWFSGGKPYDPSVRIVSMKASHHGSRSSTPVAGPYWYDNFFSFLPKNIIISNPSGRYFHPSWELVLSAALYCRVWLSVFDGASPGNEPFICALKHPFYFDMDGRNDQTYSVLKGRLFNPKSFSEDGAESTQWVNWLQAEYAELFSVMGIRCEMGDFQQCQSALTGQKNRTLMDLVKTRWLQHGWPGPARALGTVSNISGRLSDANRPVQCVMVACRDDDTDGKIKYKSYESNSLWDCRGGGFYVANKASASSNATAAVTVLAAQTYRNPQARVPVKRNNTGLQLPGSPDVIEEETDQQLSGGTMSIEEYSGLPAPLVVGANVDEQDPWIYGFKDEYLPGPVPDWPTQSSELAASSSPTAIPTRRPIPTGRDQALSIPAAQTVAGDGPSYTFAWCICSSTLQAASVAQVQPGYWNLDPNKGDWDWFVTSLRPRSIGLASNPSTGNQLDLIPLDPQDSTACWLQDSINAYDVSMINGGPGPGGQWPGPDCGIGGFQLSVNLVSALGNNGNIPLNFSTDAAAQSNAFATTSTPWPNGLRAGSTAIVLALVPQTYTSEQPAPVVNGNGLASLFGLEGMFQEPLVAALGTLNFTVPQTTNDAAGRRNAVWLIPQAALRTVIRLQLDLDSTEQDDFKAVFSEILGDFNIGNAYVVAKKEATWTSAPTIPFPSSSSTSDYQNAGIYSYSKAEIAFHTDFSITAGAVTLSFSATVEVKPGVIILSLVLDSVDGTTTGNGGAVTALLAWLQQTALPKAFFTFVDFLGQNASVMGLKNLEFDLRRITINLVQDPSDNTKLKLDSFSLDMQILWRFSDSSTEEPAYFLITYTYHSSDSTDSDSVLQASLWLAPLFDPTESDRLTLPDYETFDVLQPMGVGTYTWPSVLDLSQCSFFQNAPDVLPSTVTSASLTVNKSNFCFAGAMQAKAPAGGQPPMISLNNLAIEFGYVTDAATQTKSFKAQLDLTVLLSPPTGSTYASNGPAIITGEIGYDSGVGSWTFMASIEQLYGAYLVQFFDSSLQTAAANVLGGLELQQFQVNYNYDKNSSAASSFDISANLVLGPFTLIAKYHNGGSVSDWQFEASTDFNASQGLNMSLGDLLTAITGTQDLDLPECVTAIDIGLGTSSDTFGVFMRPSSDGTCVLLTVYAMIGDFAVQYVNFEYTTTAPQALQGVNKRMFLTSVAPMAGQTLPNIPLVGTIPQPFDELAFVWVETQTDPTQNGLTSAEVDLLNLAIADVQNIAQVTGLKTVQWQVVKKKTDPTDIVITGGKHLMLVLQDDKGPTVVIDHCFGATTTSDDEDSDDDEDEVDEEDEEEGSSEASSVASGTSSRSGSVSDQPDTSSSSGMVSYSKTFGPLTIRNLGLTVTTTVLGVNVDAIIAVGPMEFDFIGCAITLDFSSPSGGTTDSTAWSLRNLPTPSVTLQGFQVSYDSSPVDIEGMIEHMQNPNDHSDQNFYEGALTASFSPWMFKAAGCYGQSGNFETFFAYFSLQGPLISLEFAEISDITGGYGHNSNLRLPNPSDVPSFPLIDTPAATDPSGAQNALFDTSFFAPRDGARWVAVGLGITAFSILVVSAVLVIESNPSLKIGVYGIATLSLPKGASDPFAEAQLAISATLDMGAGTLKIDGQLTPASFVLDPSCHLTGGFSLYKWFVGTDTPPAADDADAALRGSWVFTIGGYHRAFLAAPQYPQPPRLGVAWDMGGGVSLTGEAYFAMTPNVCMAGGRWDISFSAGALSAWFELWADFLITLKPFHFLVDAGVDIGVKYTLDLWLVTLHISVDIGATVNAEGPPIHGTVHVNFWVFGFDIPIGDNTNDEANPLQLSQLLDLACHYTPSSLSSSVAGEKTKATADDNNPPTTAGASSRVMHVLVPETGLVPNTNTTSSTGDKWLVSPTGFSFLVSCNVPIDSASIVTLKDDGTTFFADLVNVPANTAIYARPMCQQGLQLTSTLEVTIQRAGSSATGTSGDNGEEDEEDPPEWNHNQAVIKALPCGLWGDYDPSADPSLHANDPSLLNGTNPSTTVVNLLSGIAITQPSPITSDGDTLAMFNYQVFSAEEIPVSYYFPAEDAAPAVLAPLQPATSPSAQRGSVHDTWNAAGGAKGASDQAVGFWTTIGTGLLNWDQVQLAAEPLNGEAPAALLADMQDYYPWPPMLCAAAAG